MPTNPVRELFLQAMVSRKKTSSLLIEFEISPPRSERKKILQPLDLTVIASEEAANKFKLRSHPLRAFPFIHPHFSNQHNETQQRHD